MTGVYDLLRTLHNAFGGLTLLLTIVAAVLLLATARTTSRGTTLALRADLISASVQFVIGVLLIALGFAVADVAYVAGFWLHYLLGIIAVGVVSVAAARARRAPDAEARRYGLLFLGVLAIVLVTFLVGQYDFGRG